MRHSEAVGRLGLQISKITKEVEDSHDYLAMSVREFNRAVAKQVLEFAVEELKMLPPEVATGLYTRDGDPIYDNHWESDEEKYPISGAV